VKHILAVAALVAALALGSAAAVYATATHEVNGQPHVDCTGATINYQKFGTGGTIHAELLSDGTVVASTPAAGVTITTDTYTLRLDANLSGDHMIEVRTSWTSSDGPGQLAPPYSVHQVCTSTSHTDTETVHDTTTVAVTSTVVSTATTTAPAVTVTQTLPAKLAPPKTVTVYRTRTIVKHVKAKKVCPPPPTCASLGQGLVGKFPHCGAAAKG
jgi:hypothetical protein